MKSIQVMFDKKLDYQESLNDLTTLFNVTDNTERENLHFVTISADLVNIEFTQTCTIIRSIEKPHICVAIPNKCLWSIEVRI